MKYHALFVIFEKAAKNLIVVCCKVIGDALRVKGKEGDRLKTNTAFQRLGF